MEVNSLFLIIKAKLPARVLHQKRKNWIWYLLCIGSKFTLVQFYFSFTRELWGLWKWVFTNGKYNLSLLTQTSIFSASLRMWLNGGKVFFRHCSPRSISFNDTAILRKFYPKKFHPWCNSKKLSKDLPLTWWEFAYDYTSDHRRVHNL